MNHVRARIESLERSRFVRDGESVRRMRQAESPKDAFFWLELVPEHKVAVIESSVSWQGFRPDQQMDVMENVLAGKEASHWMDGIEPDKPTFREVFRSLRDRGYRGVRKEFFHELGLIAEYPDESSRESGLRKIWDGLSEEQSRRLADHSAGDGSSVDARTESNHQFDKSPSAAKAELSTMFRDIAEQEKGWAPSPEDEPVTKAFVEWELGKIRMRYMDDDAERPRDLWPETADAEKLTEIYRRTRIKDLDTTTARQILGRELDLDQVSQAEQQSILGTDWGRLAAPESPDFGATRPSYIPETLSPSDASDLARELDAIRRDTYVESPEEFACWWNYERGDGGVPFHELPVADREVLIEDYVDWGKYMERGLTFEDQGRIMFHGARDVRDDYARKIDEQANRPQPEQDNELER